MFSIFHRFSSHHSLHLFHFQSWWWLFSSLLLNLMWYMCYILALYSFDVVRSLLLFCARAISFFFSSFVTFCWHSLTLSLFLSHSLIYCHHIRRTIIHISSDFFFLLIISFTVLCNRRYTVVHSLKKNTHSSKAKEKKKHTIMYIRSLSSEI